jgi:Xaa-Pro aminopeptidase
LTEELMALHRWTLMKQGLPQIPTWAQYLKNDLPASTKVGIDPTLLPSSEHASLRTSLSSAKSTIVPIKENLIDIIWSGDKPPRPANEVFQLEDRYTGENVGSKLSLLRERFGKVGAKGLVVSQLDEVAWLFNLRGSDIPYNPVCC